MKKQLLSRLNNQLNFRFSSDFHFSPQISEDWKVISSKPSTQEHEKMKQVTTTR